MITNRDRGWRTRAAGLACALAAVGTLPAQTATETVIHSFGFFTSGANPCGNLFRNRQGTLYGATYNGGRENEGVVFELGSAGYKVLHSFQGGTDGANPYSGVIEDPAGNLYGTTYQGGSSGAGVVYKVDPSGQETVLYTFTGGADGGHPYAGVIVDSSGNLFGTTYSGGLTNCTGGCGVVYKISPLGKETVLYSFTGGADGANPYGGVTSDGEGNLFGTTYRGGANQIGVIYKLSASGQESVPLAFTIGSSSGGPTSGVVRDSSGNLYGTTYADVYKLTPAGQFQVLGEFSTFTWGPVSPANVALDGEGNLYGNTDVPSRSGTRTPYGVLYKIDTTGHIAIVYAFPGPPAASNAVGFGPSGGVVADSAGNVYGITPYSGVGGAIYKVDAAGQETTLFSFPGAPGGTLPYGGATVAQGSLYGVTKTGGQWNAGVVFKLDARGNETVLHEFTGGADGIDPESAVVLDAAGNVYGTTIGGGAANAGVVYMVDTSGNETVLYSFTGGADGAMPNGVIVDSQGNLYGTTFGGGDGSATGIQEGVLFKLDPVGNLTVLHSFTGLSDGGVPTAGVIRDSAGNLYGTTNEGGLGVGVIYKIDPSGEETVLYTFGGGSDGGNPIGGVIFGPDGALYGATSGGGKPASGDEGEGVVFKFAARQYAVLYTFSGGPDGGFPAQGVVRDAGGNLYGTTSGGGSECGCGVVFEVDPAGQETVLYTFTGGSDGAEPWSGVVLGQDGKLYGTTPSGGLGTYTVGPLGDGWGGSGVVYRINTP